METNKKAGDDEQEFTRQDEQLCCRNNGVKWKSRNESQLLTKMKKLPPDEERCSQTDGKGWRCRNFRRSNGAPKSLCEKHYSYIAYQKKKKKKKKTRGDGETRGWKRRRKEEDDETTTQKLGVTIHDTSADTVIGDCNIRRKRKNIEFESIEYYKNKCFELSLELEKKKIECTKLQGQLAEVVRSRKTTATDEIEEIPAGETQCWRKMFSNLESRFLRMENREERVESRISKLESLVLRSGKENSTLRFVDLHDSVKIDGLQNDVTQSIEKQRDETSCGGGEYTHEHDVKIKDEVLSTYENIEEVKGCSEERPSQDHSNFVSHANSGESLGESDDSDSSGDTETSLGSLMDMLAMKYRNKSEDQELKWKFEADMLSSFEEDPELNMKAVCALYRQHTAEVEISAKGLFHYSDMLRATTLAKFLMDGAYKGDLKKSLKELEQFDPRGVEDCKRLARSYSKQLFSIYQNRKDPFFPSMETT